MTPTNTSPRSTAHDGAPSSAGRGSAGKRRRWALSVTLAVAVLAVFGRAATFDFVTYDDPLYVTENAMVQRGLTMDSLAWAMTSLEADNWHPLTWVSHILDWQLWGSDPGGHHLTSLLLHAVAAVLLFLALDRMTGRPWPSALVAGLFALHPLRVESVVWVAERKDVLSGALAMAVILAWARYAERPSVRRYLLVALLLALGLCAKPMLVTLPFALLLLDLWPLGRAEISALGTSAAARQRLLRLLLEKLPLLALAAGSAVATLIAQRGAMGGVDELPVAARVGNALVAWVVYLGKSVLPTCLAVFYPHPAGGLPTWQPVAAAVLLLAISTVVILRAGRRPWLATGWFWYLGMLVPVIGFVQVGSQAFADRYTYLPQIGLWILVAFGLSELVERRPSLRAPAVGIAGSCLLLAAAAASIQVGHWRSSETLYRRAIACTEGNWVAHTNLAEVLLAEGRLAEAVDQAQASITAHPEATAPYVLMGNAFMGLDRPTEAAVAFRRAVELEPENAALHSNVGIALAGSGDSAGAEESYRAALTADPAHVPARINLGVILLRQLKAEAAAEVLCIEGPEQGRTALLDYNCGLALAQLDRLDEAVARFERAATLDPRHLPSRRNLGLLLEHLGRRDEARTVLEEASRLAPSDPGLAQALERLRTTPVAQPGGDP